MLFSSQYGETTLDSQTKRDIDWFSDLVIKVLCVAATALLGVAVSSLQSMNTEIKELSNNVFDLSAHTKVINVSLESLKERIVKLEEEVERLRTVKLDKPDR
jgi:septal ring factor EnvC (AmiA/AmiB activator)